MMFPDIGGWISGIFGPYGAIGVVLLVFLVFLIDALLFPTLPELFFVIGFMFDPTLSFGLILLGAAVAGEVIGISSLYYVIERVKVPQRVKNVADKYVGFLIVSDERMLLVNRIAPMIPFAGAFISIVDGWKLNRALFYVVIGCILKYGVIMLMSSFFFAYFSSGAAQTYTLVFVFSVIIISLLFAFLRKKRVGINENS
jgi:hypothetical protein